MPGGGDDSGGFIFVSPGDGDLGEFFRAVGNGLKAVACFLFGPCGPQPASSQGAGSPSDEVEFSQYAERRHPGQGNRNTTSSGGTTTGGVEPPPIVPPGPPGGPGGGGGGGGRNTPPLAATMVFNVTDGRLLVSQSREELLSLDATSGKGACMNNPSCYGNRSIGPIPRGRYLLYTRYLSAPNPLVILGRYVRSRLNWGSFRVPLVPGMTTNVLATDGYPREGFYLHGGMSPGSAGCIDAGGGLFGNRATGALVCLIRNDADGVIPVEVVP